MQIDITSENAFARKVAVTVPADRVRRALDDAYRAVVRSARLPGFRKGKVPRRVLEARFGASIANDVAGDLIQAGWTSALTEHELEPVGRPAIVEQGEIAMGIDFTFVIGVDVKPVVEAGVVEGLEVYWPKPEISDADVDALLERRRQAQSRLTAVDGRPVEAGDTVQVEITAKDGDDVVLSEPGTLVRTEGEAWLTGLEGELIGLSADESKEASVTFAASAKNADVAGKTLDVALKVLSIQAIEAPPLDDALAKELGHDDVAAWKEAIRAELLSGLEDRARDQARANLLDSLIQANPVDVPDGMVEQNLKLLLDEVRMQQAYAGVDPKTVRFTDAQIADLRGRALFAARGGLLLESVSTSQALEVSDAEVDARIVELAEARGQEVEAVRGWFQQDGSLEELRNRLLEEKTLDWLLERAVISHEAPEPAPAPEAPAVEAEPAKKPAKKTAAAKKAAPKAKAEAAPKAEAKKPAAKKSGGSKYKTIAGVKYARDLLEQAEAAGDTVDLATIQAIVESAKDGKGITDVEKRSIAYVRDEMTLAADAAAWLADAVDLDS